MRQDDVKAKKGQEKILEKFEKRSLKDSWWMTEDSRRINSQKEKILKWY